MSNPFVVADRRASRPDALRRPAGSELSKSGVGRWTADLYDITPIVQKRSDIAAYLKGANPSRLALAFNTTRCKLLLDDLRWLEQSKAETDGMTQANRAGDAHCYRTLCSASGCLHPEPVDLNAGVNDVSRAEDLKVYTKPGTA